MKKHFYIVLFLFALGKCATAQEVHKYWMGDTAHVRVSYDTTMHFYPIVDTVALTKYSFRGSVYWDKEMKQKYSICYPNGKYSDTTWYNNGQISEIVASIFDSVGKHIGINESGWYRDGREKIITLFEGNKEITTYYSPNGKVSGANTFLRGYSGDDYYTWVYEERWCENGLRIGGDSLVWHSLHAHLEKVFYCDGNIKAEYWLFNGLPYGTFKRWHENGQLQSIEQYDDTSHLQLSYHVPKKQGTWKYYNESGKLIKEQTYKDDVMINEKKY